MWRRRQDGTKAARSSSARLGGQVLSEGYLRRAKVLVRPGRSAPHHILAARRRLGEVASRSRRGGPARRTARVEYVGGGGRVLGGAFGGSGSGVGEGD